MLGKFVTVKLKGIDDCRQGVVINIDPLRIRGQSSFEYECEGTPILVVNPPEKQGEIKIMERERLFERLSYRDENDNDELGMILSNRCDMAIDNGALISLKAFPALIKDIKQWRINKNKRIGLQGVLSWFR